MLGHLLPLQHKGPCEAMAMGCSLGADEVGLKVPLPVPIST
jgi:hypothetical protein